MNKLAVAMLGVYETLAVKFHEEMPISFAEL
jgi:hypothetical protein